MLLEDIVIMEPGEKCIMYISHDHPLIQTDSMKRDIMECVDIHRWKPKQLQKTWYIPLEVTLRSNPLREKLTADPPHYQENDIVNMFQPAYGAGVNFALVNNVNIKIKFHHLLDDPKKLMFWRKHDSKQNGKINLVLKQMGKLKLQESYGAWAD